MIYTEGLRWLHHNLKCSVFNQWDLRTGATDADLCHYEGLAREIAGGLASQVMKTVSHRRRSYLAVITHQPGSFSHRGQPIVRRDGSEFVEWEANYIGRNPARKVKGSEVWSKNALNPYEDLTMKKHVECPPGVRQHHEQMLRLVAKSFYNELINYGVNEAEVLSVAGHLLDNVMQKSAPSTQQADYYNTHFTLKNVNDDWPSSRRMSVQDVSLIPMIPEAIPQILTWLRVPEIRESFYPKFPETEKELIHYFQNPNREYFSILYKDELAGIMGAENIDRDALKLEMRKLVGDARMHGKGIGKRATFLFLYHVFEIRKFQKVYLHSLDINIRNINLNGKFGFELEGVFLEEAMVANRRRDVVRMALAGPRWLQIFA